MDDIVVMMEREAGMPPEVPAVGVGFGFHPLKDADKSNAEGRPIYRSVEFIKVTIPGDEKSVVFRPATSKDRERFPQAYRRFKDSEKTPVDGTPLEQWPQLTRAEAMNLKSLNIATVEMLAEVHDGNVGKLGMNGRNYVAKAKAFVAQAKDTAAAQRLAEENQGLKDMIADLQRQINDIGKRGPGRPRKEDAVA